MNVFRGIAGFLTAVALAAVFAAAGLAVCLLPPVTHALSSVFALDGLSPYDRTQLVEVADATRDYSFGSHDKGDLYRAIYQVASDYRDGIVASGGAVPSDFPKLDAASSLTNPAELEKAFAGASELYCFSPETVSHLDDCYRIAATAFPILIVCCAIAVVGLVFTGVTGRKRSVRGVLIASGVAVVVAFVGLGVWAVADFNGLFTMFHQLFFSQGNWVFPYDSLLICSLPTQFWAGMAVVWLLVSILVSAASIAIGARLRT